MTNYWYKCGNFYFIIIKSVLLVQFCLLLNTGCRSDKTIFNSAPLAPLINSRYSARNSVKTLIYLKNQSIINNTQYIQGRHLYNRAATNVNGLITHIIISVQANSKFGNSKYFQKQVIKTFESSVAFQKYVERLPTNKSGTGTRGFTRNPSITFQPITIDTNAILEAIKEAAKAARKANSQQRAIIVCELKSLLLPDFDTIKSNPSVENYPDKKCIEWIEKKIFTEPQ